jgi:hypothetical protein
MKDPWIGDIMVLLTEWAHEPHDQACPKDGSPCRHARATIAIQEIKNAAAEIRSQELSRKE